MKKNKQNEMFVMINKLFDQNNIVIKMIKDQHDEVKLDIGLMKTRVDKLEDKVFKQTKKGVK